MRWSVVALIAVVALSAGGALVGGSSAQAGDSVTVRLEPTEETVPEDDTVTFDLVADGLDRGLSSFNVTVTTSDWEVARLRDTPVEVDATDFRGRGSLDGRTLDVREVRESVDGEVTLASVDVLGDEPGSVDLDVAVGGLTAEDGSRYDVAATAGASVDVEQDGPGARTRLYVNDSIDHNHRELVAGQRTYWDVVLDDPDAGVRNVTYEVRLANGTVASIENASVAGTPGETNVSVSDDGDTARVAVTGADLTGEERTTVGSLVLRGEVAGRTDVTLDVHSATNLRDEPYRITTQRSGEMTVHPRRGSSADVRIEPSAEQPSRGASFDVVASNLTGGLTAFEVHLSGLAQTPSDHELFPDLDVHPGSRGSISQGELWLSASTFDGEVEGSEVVLARVVLDEAAGPHAVDPQVRPLSVLDAEERAYDVGYVPLREVDRSRDGTAAGGSSATPLLAVTALVVLAVGGYVLWRRRRSGTDDRDA